MKRDNDLWDQIIFNYSNFYMICEKNQKLKIITCLFNFYRSSFVGIGRNKALFLIALTLQQIIESTKKY